MSEPILLLGFILIAAMAVYVMALSKRRTDIIRASGKEQPPKENDVVSLRLIGYWPGGEDPGCPEPAWFVDSKWDPAERALVCTYLKSGTELFQYCGLSWCRFGCESFLGSKELTDGFYYWPEGLLHYLEWHNVKLPQEFIDHVKARTIQSSAAVNKKLGSPRTDIANPWQSAGVDEEGRETFVMLDSPRKKLKLDKRWWKAQKGHSADTAVKP